MILNILTLIAGTISIALAIIVLAEGTHTKSIRTAYAMFAGSVGLWAIFLGLFLVAPSSNFSVVSVFTYYSLGLLIPYSFLFFSLAYLSIKVLLSVRLFALLPWVFMTILLMSPGGMIASIDAGPAKIVELVHASYFLYSAIFVLYVFMGLWFLITKAARAKGLHAHRRIVALSLFIGFSGGGYFDIILPLLGNYELIVYGPLFAFVTSAGIFYVIAKHGLFDIRTAAIRTFAYALSLATLAGIYYVIAYLISITLLHFQGQSSVVLLSPYSVILALILAFVFQPVKQFFDRLTSQLFYKDSYDADDFYGALNKVLTSTTDLRNLLKRTSAMISDTFKSEQTFFFVYTNKNSFMSSGTDKHSKLPIGDAEELRLFNDIVMLESPAVPYDIRRMMASHRIALVMPLYRDEQLIGYVCLGDHKTSSYSRRDKRVLRTIADELIIAIQNALSVQEVKDLNANLEQRIESATRELRASNAQLQKLDEAKDEFISMASHQLRTPLTSIKGYVSMLMDGDVGAVSKEQKHLLQEAFISSERMVRLIGDFLNVSRLQTGKFVIDKHPIDLAKVVQQEVEGLEPNASARGMKFVYKKPNNIPLLDLDENKIQQVIMNFSDNAIYYSKENSTIKLNLAVVGEYIEFTVKDNGIGVPIAEQEQLFNKFFRATNARKQRPDGTGVGLFLAKKVIDAHGGQIIFASKEGRGSTFGFRLPIRKLRSAS